VQQGGVKLDHAKMTDPRGRIEAGRTALLEVGRRAVRIVIS
jgi:hypothetical protein